MFRKFFVLTILSLVMFSCESDYARTNNPFVPTYSFGFTIDMQLPMYSSLIYPSNAVLVTLIGAGTNGVIVFNTGAGYRAYEANCPNQYMSSCSQLQTNGIRAVCPCDELEYSLYTGLPVTEGDYAMIPYRVELRGTNQLYISN
jgi:nitrite reductase/ring-hydroxylating ferredoxin subunit